MSSPFRVARKGLVDYDVHCAGQVQPVEGEEDIGPDPPLRQVIIFEALVLEKFAIPTYHNSNLLRTDMFVHRGEEVSNFGNLGVPDLCKDFHVIQS